MKEVVVLGAGMHRYGNHPDKSVAALGAEAVGNALKDANLDWEEVEVAYCGTAQPGFATGHAVCREMGLTGLGVTNVENASASGSAAFREAVLAVGSGVHEVAIAIGVDKMPPRPPKTASSAPRLSPVHWFAELAREHMETYGTTLDQLAQVSVKSHYNASLNPYAHYRKAITLKEVHQARMVADPLTVLHCCPWDDGGAAVIVCSREVADRATDKVCPRITASILKSTLSDDPAADLTAVTAKTAYRTAGIEPRDLDLVELHDAFTIEEIMFAEALGLCEKGKGGRLVEEGVTALDGRHPINSSGGLISVGHPIGPTGVGQVAEILWQMRGECGPRQITKPVKTAMAHMVGATGVCIVHLFQRN
ncbi:MAG: thiolase family protein [Desulfobacterales bacterium]|nr:thiolase family protein [Desulfobacterales bacterium]